jgi:hypothetical protein
LRFFLANFASRCIENIECAVKLLNADSTHDFSQFQSNLPRIPFPEVPLELHYVADPGLDDFTQWQLNRSGNITLCTIFSFAYRLTIRHFKLFILFFVPYAAATVATLCKRWLLLFVPIEAFLSLCVFALIANNKWHSRLRFFFTTRC